MCCKHWVHTSSFSWTWIRFCNRFFFIFILVFVLMAGLVVKLKYVLTPFMCLMASSLPPKSWFPNATYRYWFVYLFLVFCSIAETGIEVRIIFIQTCKGCCTSRWTKNINCLEGLFFKVNAPVGYTIFNKCKRRTLIQSMTVVFVGEVAHSV